MLFYDEDTKMLYLALKVHSHQSRTNSVHVFFPFRTSQQLTSLKQSTSLHTFPEVYPYIKSVRLYSDIYFASGGDVCRCPAQTKGMAMLPKRAVDVMSCEVARFMQLTQNAIVPISYCVQRKVYTHIYIPLCISYLRFLYSLTLSFFLSFFLSLSLSLSHTLSLSFCQSHTDFHADLFPDTVGSTPALTAQEWTAGGNASVGDLTLYVMCCLESQQSLLGCSSQPRSSEGQNNS